MVLSRKKNSRGTKSGSQGVEDTMLMSISYNLATEIGILRYSSSEGINICHQFSKTP